MYPYGNPGSGEKFALFAVWFCLSFLVFLLVVGIVKAFAWLT